MMVESNPGWASAAMELQTALGHQFERQELLKLALTHPSWANEHNQPEHNQRLEFLGDAVLELCVSQQLYDRYPEAREGSLTQMRNNLVNESSLAAIARAIGLNKLTLLGKGERNNGGHEKDSILADAFESVLAAVYEDGGFEAAQKTVGLLFANIWPAASTPAKEKDPKSRLQEYCQKEYRENPIYVLLGSSGPEHAKNFTVQLTLPTGQSFCATESSCKRAEQAAAAMFFERLESEK